MEYPYIKIINLKNKINLNSIKVFSKYKIEDHNANYKAILGFGRDYLAFIAPMFDIRDANGDMKIGLSEIIIPGTGISYNDILVEASYDPEVLSLDASIGAMARGKRLALTMKIVPIFVDIIYTKRTIPHKIRGTITELDFNRLKSSQKAWVRNDNRSKEANELLEKWNARKPK